MKAVVPVAVLLAAVLPAAPAAASTSQTTVFQDDHQIVATSSAHRAAVLDELKALGVDVVKIRIDWRGVAPAPKSKKKPAGFSGEDSSKYPKGAWGNFDNVLRAITERGMTPYVLLGGASPNWGGAKDGRGGHPNPTEFRRFVQAVGSRYSGSFGGPLYLDPMHPLPRVKIWSAWNEPNLSGWISPQYSHKRPVSPRVYRQVVVAAHDGLALSGHGDDQLLIGELMPFARSGTSNKMRPLAFLRELGCVDGGYHPFKGKTAKQHGCDKFTPVPGTGLAYHPYTLAGGPDVGNPNHDDASIGELGRVTRVLDRLGGANRLTTHRMPVWIAEFGFQTDPPDHYQTPIKKVPDFLGESEWLAYRNPRVASYAQYPLRDDPGLNGFQSGLRTKSGKKKSGVYDAFRIPLFVQRRSDKVVEVFGGIRAGSQGQQVTVESRLGKGSYKPLSGGTLTLGPQGYFDRVFSVSSAAKRQYRFRFSGGKSRSAGVHR